MAVTFTGAGTAVAASGASPAGFNTTTAFAVGDYLVVLVAYDNSGGGGADPMTVTVTAAPQVGALGAAVSTQTGLNDPGAASAGLAARCVVYPVTTAIPSGTQIIFSWAGTIVVRAWALMKVSSAGTTGYRTNHGATGVNGVAVTTVAHTTPSVNSGEGVLCWAGHENGAAITGDADTTNGTWSAVYGTFTGTTLAGQAAYFQSKVVTATATQTWNPTGASSDWIVGSLIFTETIPPAITQAAYQFFDDAGTESGAAALGALNTAINPLLVGADGFGVLRVRLQSTTAVAVPATDDFQLQYEMNASGSWINEGTGAVVAYNNPNLTDAAATTNRLGAGTGSFVAGKISETGDVQNLGWTANNYTELVYSLQLVAAQLAGGDVLRFRVLRNGATTGMTYSVTPTINIKVPVALAGGSNGTSGATGTLQTVAAAAVGTRALEDGSQRSTEADLPRALENAPGVVNLDGLSPAQGTATGSLGVAFRLTAVAPAGTSTAQATTLIAARGLVATAPGTSTASGTMLVVARALVAVAPAGTSTTTGTLGKSVPVVGTAGGTSTTTGTLDTSKAVSALDGSAGGTSTAGGSLIVAVALVGTSTASSTANAAMPVARALAGTAGATSTATATTLVRSIPLAAPVVGGSSTTTGALSTVVGLAGSTPGGSATTGTLIAARALTAPASTGTSSTTAALAVARPLAATSTGGSTTTAAMATADALIGSAAGGSTTTGDLTVAVALIGSTTGTSTVTGNIVSGGFTALTIGTSTTTGSLRVARALAGSTSGLSTASATSLSRTIQVVASYTGGSTITSGALSVARTLAGSTAGASTTTGAFVRSVAFAGSASGLAATSGALARAVPLAGIPVAGSSSTTAAARVARGLDGSSSGLSTSTAAARVALTLTGTTGGISTADGLRLLLVVGLFGSTDGFATANGDMTAIKIIPTYGLWNGKVFNAMQYGDKQVVDWMLTPP